MEKNKWLLGYPVDEATYKRYTERKYWFGGLFPTWEKLSFIEHFSCYNNSFQEEAKQVISEIRAEIRALDGKDNGMDRFLCGVACDEEGYNEFMKRTYKIKSDKDMYPSNRDYNLEQISFFANSKEYREKAPEFWVEAKEIWDNAAKEIKEYYAAKDGRKGYKAMKHDTFNGYLDDVKAVQESSIVEYAALQEKIKKDREDWKKEQRDFANDERMLTKCKATYLDAEADYKTKLEDLQKRTKESIDVVRGELQEHLTDFYSPNGARIDDDVVKLIHSGLKLSQEEFEDIVSKNLHNPTMLRLLSDFGEEHKLSTQETRALGHYSKQGGKSELEIFDAFRQYAENSILDDKGHIWQDHFERAYNQSIVNLANMVVRPAADNNC